MDYRVRFTEASLKDLRSLIDYICKDSAAAAERFGTALLDHVNLLERFPKLGSPVPRRAGVRKLLHSPIRIYYRLHLLGGGLAGCDFIVTRHPRGRVRFFSKSFIKRNR